MNGCFNASIEKWSQCNHENMWQNFLLNIIKKTLLKAYKRHTTFDRFQNKEFRGDVKDILQHSNLNQTCCEEGFWYHVKPQWKRSITKRLNVYRKFTNNNNLINFYSHHNIILISGIIIKTLRIYNPRYLHDKEKYNKSTFKFFQIPNYFIYLYGLSTATLL